MSYPTLLLLPGFDGTGALFRPLTAAMGGAARAQTVAYDDHADLQGYLQQAKALCPSDEPVVVLAESFSGPIGLELLAATMPNIVGGILSTTFAKPPLSLIISLAEKLRLASFTLPAVSEQILRLFCLNGVSDIPLIKEIAGVVRQVGSAAVQSRFTAMAQMDATRKLPTIKVPVLVLQAGNDRVLRSRYSRSLCEQIPRVRSETVDGPHLLLQARATESARHITRFLATLEK